MNEEVIRLTMVVENMGDENRALTDELARVKQQNADIESLLIWRVEQAKEAGARSAFEMSIEMDIPKWVDEPQRSEQVASELEAAMVAWRERESRQEFSTKAAAFSDVVKELAKDDK